MANVLCFAVIDNGGQMINLTNALNRYTDHQARCITVNNSYLNYDTDILFGTSMDLLRLYELRDMLSKTDFFIFSEVLPIDVKDLLDHLHVYQKISPSNTIIRTAGSYRTLNPTKLLRAWTQENWMFAGPYSDWYISGRIGRMAPVNYICPVDKIPDRHSTDGVIRVCFSPTRKEKGADAFNRAMDKITTKYDHVEKVIISNVSWEESIMIKSTCHITFDQFMLHHYANSAIESMYLGHTVLSDVRPWCRMIHPDLPIIGVHNEGELYSTLSDVIEHEELGWIGAEGNQYVLKYHHPEVVAKQWGHLINHVKSM